MINIKKLLQKCINKLSSHQFDIVEDDFLPILIVKATNSGILAYLGPKLINGKIKYQLEISELVLKDELQDMVELIIYHELAHYFQFKYCFSNNYLEITNTGKLFSTKESRNKIVDLLLGNDGHPELWQYYAGKIAITLNLNKLSAFDSKEITDRICKVNNLEAGYFDNVNIVENYIIETENENIYMIDHRKIFTDFFKQQYLDESRIPLSHPEEIFKMKDDIKTICENISFKEN